ncbi:MAG: hypothetical protein WAT39_17630 [Planctomycetota bacterium]
MRVGGAVGYALVDVSLDSDPPPGGGLPVVDPDLAPAEGVAAFLEVVAMGTDSDVHLRALGSHAQARVLGSNSDADVWQAWACGCGRRT